MALSSVSRSYDPALARKKEDNRLDKTRTPRLEAAEWKMRIIKKVGLDADLLLVPHGTWLSGGIAC